MPRLHALAMLLLLLAALPLAAAPLPDDPRLEKPVTLTVVDRPVEQVLDTLSRQTSVQLSVDDWVAQERITAGAQACPARDLMHSVAALLHLRWEPEGREGYRLRAPAITPPARDTSRLIARLAAGCPAWARPLPGTPTPSTLGGVHYTPLEAVFAALPQDTCDVLEDGEALPYARIPWVARQYLARWFRERAHADLVRALNPTWNVPPAQLGVRFTAVSGQLAAEVVRQAGNEGPPAAAAAARRSPARPAWKPAADIPFSFFPRQDSPPPPQPGTVAHAALALSRKAGVTVVLAGAGGNAAGRQSGENAAERLESLIPTDRLVRWAWRRSGKAYWLDTRSTWWVRCEGSEMARYRRLMGQVLPGEYAPLFDLPGGERRYALRSLWSGFWRSLTPALGAPGEPLPWSALGAEQRRWLCAALQAYMVGEVWSVLERALGGDRERSTLSLDFARRWPSGLGYLQMLSLRDGDRVLSLSLGGDRPPILPMLPSDDANLGRQIDLDARDLPLSELLARLADVLSVSVIAEEPEAEARLTGRFARRPARLLFHWIERRTGLQWSKRGDVYVLGPALTAGRFAGAADSLLGALHQQIPMHVRQDPRGDAEVQSAAEQALRESLTDADRQALSTGFVRLGQAAPAIQDAARTLVWSQIRRYLAEAAPNRQMLGRLQDARVRLDADGKTPALVLEVPGLPPVRLDVPEAEE